MAKHILKELEVLLAEGILTPETATHIRQYYKQKEDSAPNRLLIVFGVLGAILVGLGLIFDSGTLVA